MSDRAGRPIAGIALGGMLVVLVLLDLTGAMATVWREVALVAGGAMAIPFVISRRRSFTVHRCVVVGFAAAVTVGAVISALVHAGAAPFPQYLVGWDGRGTGIYAYAAATVLLAAATVLTRREVLAVVALLAVAGLLSAITTVGQALMGESRRADGLSGLMGNADFNAVICGMAAGVLLLLAVRVWRVPRWRPSGLVVLATVCAAGAVLTGSWQGLAALAIVVGVGVLVILIVRASLGWAIGVGAFLCVGAVVTLLVVVGVIELPGAAFAARRAYWATVISTVAHEPLTGVGPDSFAEAVARFRTDAYLAVRPPSHFVSAAHSVPLQIAATIGLPALVMWVGMMVSALIVAIRGVTQQVQHAIAEGRGSVAVRRAAVLLGVVLGVWCAYVAQALISIDQLVLLALGWIATGALIAVADPREIAPRPTSPWRITASVACGAIGLVAVAPYPISYTAALSASSPAQEAQVLTSPWTTCAQRTQVASTSFVDLATLTGAFDMDPRCPGLGTVVARRALEAGDLSTAVHVLSVTMANTSRDPETWILLGIADVRAGRLPEARNDLASARAAARGPWQASYRPGLRYLARLIRGDHSAQRA